MKRRHRPRHRHPINLRNDWCSEVHHIWRTSPRVVSKSRGQELTDQGPQLKLTEIGLLSSQIRLSSKFTESLASVCTTQTDEIKYGRTREPFSESHSAEKTFVLGAIKFQTCSELIFCDNWALTVNRKCSSRLIPFASFMGT